MRRHVAKIWTGYPKQRELRSQPKVRDQHGGLLHLLTASPATNTTTPNHSQTMICYAVTNLDTEEQSFITATKSEHNEITLQVSPSPVSTEHSDNDDEILKTIPPSNNHC